MKIESTDQDIRTLLSSGYYRIPRFQRPYSWDRDNIQDFWNDIIKDQSADYFIGSMVVYKEGNQRYGVVDGQQRLTTITILLCVLRNFFEKLGHADLARGIQGLVERNNIENQQEFVLSTETSYPFFQDHIQKWGRPEVDTSQLKEEDNLRNSYTQLTSLVMGAIQSIEDNTTITEREKQKQKKEVLIEIRDALLNLKIIFVKMDNEDDAYIIFETLNTRGKDLSLSDLVKNHLTKHLRNKSKSIDQTKIKWEKILETIESSSSDISTDTFIHHFWLSKYEYLPSKKIFKELKKQVTNTNARNFLDSLAKDSVIYRYIHETNYKTWSKPEKDVRNSLDALQAFRVQQQTPCVLSLAREYENKKLKIRHLKEALFSIENFHFLFTAVTSQRSSGGISGMYASLGRRLYEAVDTQECVQIIKELKEKLRERIPDKSEFKALFPHIIYTNNFSKQRKLVKYILVNLYKHTNKNGVPTDFDSMTIEHLIPQSLIGKTTNYTDQIIGQLGNLILVDESTNLQLSEKAFSEKMQILKTSQYPLPDELKDKTQFTHKDIDERTDLLAEVAYDTIWKI